MVRLKGPLFSLEASGSLGKCLVFAKWKGRDYSRRHAVPANPQSALQVAVRAVFGFIAEDYTNLSAADVADWEAIAANTDITPMNAQIADAVDRARRNLGWRENLTDADPAAVDAPAAEAAAAQPNALLLTWNNPVANLPDYCWAIYHSTVLGFTPSIANLVAVVKFGTNTWTHKGLTTGVLQYYQIRGLSTSGFLGTLGGEFNGTPT